MPRITLLLCLLLIALPARGRAQDVRNLAIGDPARKAREAPVVLDAITDTTTGDLLTPAELAARLADVRLVFVGESHADMDFHRAQLSVIDALRKAGRQVLIGLEMYPYTQQPFLDRWIDGTVTEPQFVAESRWYRHWGYHWQYYRDIFNLARLHRLRMFAVNTPREVVTAVRKKGLKNLTPEEAAHIPAEIDTSNADHRQLFKAFFAGSESNTHGSSMTDDQWDAMFAAQCTWDATMGFNAVKALERYGSKDAIMVVLIGSGHVAYGLGAERQAARWFDGRIASIIPVAVMDRSQKPTASVRASYANFVWGLPPESDSLFPSLGVSTIEAAGGLQVIDVEKNSPAAAAGIQVQDRLVSLDGAPVRDKEAFSAAMAEKRWGDSVIVAVTRGGTDVKVNVVLRRRTDR
jgi:aminopeptidase N